MRYRGIHGGADAGRSILDHVEVVGGRAAGIQRIRAVARANKDGVEVAELILGLNEVRAVEEAPVTGLVEGPCRVTAERGQQRQLPVTAIAAGKIDNINKGVPGRRAKSSENEE